jgi:sporulation protein YlmC with PRC-barrel domain
MAAELRLEDLIGRHVLDEHGKRVGRIEEAVARREAAALVIVEFRLGVYARLSRLGAGTFARVVLNALPFTRPTLYRVPWQALDLSDPERPRLRVSREELEAAA